MIFGLSCEHPDIEEFLTIKQNTDQIKCANLSVLYTDAFMKAVECRENFTLHFDVEASGEVEHIRREINAYDFFHKFAESQHSYAEPGAIWIDTVRANHYMSAYPETQYRIDISNPCFTGDMQLLTVKGYKTFSELSSKNQRVDVVSFDGTVSSGKVWSNGVKDIVKVAYGNKKTKKEIKCTPDHVFMLTDGTECLAKDLKGKQLKPFCCTPQGAFNPLYVKLGFIQGDGQLTDLNNPAKEGIEINFGKDDDDILSLFNYTRADMQKDGRTKYTTEYLCDILSLGMSIEPLPSRTLPTGYKKLAKADKLSFLRGMYSANGSVLGGSGDARVTYKTTCNELAQEILNSLKEFGISAYITTNKAKNVEFSNGNYICKESYDVNISAYFDKLLFSQIIGFEQEYKNSKLCDWLNAKAPRVESVTPAGKEEVFDFSEPNNHWGVVKDVVVHNCSEYFGNAYNSCNLGSINLYNYVLNPFTTKASFNYAEFKKDVASSVFALDAILDYGYDMQPLDANREVLKDWRAIGLGVMGMADMFVAMGVAYGSKESKNLIDQVMKSMHISAVEASVELSIANGPFPQYDFTKVSKSPLFRILPPTTKALVKEHGLRNCSLLSIAPTGSLSSMLGISGGAEPFFQISFERTTHAQEDGAKETFTVFAKAVEHLLEANGIDKDSITVEEIKSRFPFVVDAHDVPWKDRVELQATMQKYVDNAISSTINLPEETSVEDIVNIYLHAWRSGCKGITIFRHNCLRPSILGVSEAAQDEEKYGLYGVNFDSITPLKRKNLPEETEYKAENAIAHTACVKNMHGFITTLDDNLFEAFTFPSGGCTANIATITRLCSLAFRSGVKVSEVLSELRSTHCAACLKLREQGNDNISKSCGGAIADIIEKCYHKELAERPELSDMKLCPKCGKKAMMPGKCGTCANCGYNACT